MSRIGVVFLSGLAVLAVAGPTAPASAAKRKPPKAVPYCRVPLVTKHCRPLQGGTPVTVTLLGGSAVTVATAAGEGGSAPLTGSLRGIIKGGYKISQTNPITLTTGHFDVAPVPLVRDACTSPWAAATSALSTLGLLPGPRSRMVIGRTGDVTLTLPARLRLVLDVRTGACGGPTATTGYADTPLELTAGGKIVMGQGLSHLTLDGGPTAPTDLRTCTTPGAPTAACAADTSATTATLTPHLEVAIRVG
jgi:hypothetical protein